MQNLIDFITEYKHWFIFLLFEILSLCMLFNCNGYQSSAYYSSANALIGGLYEAGSSVSSFVKLKSNNMRLEHVNDSLQQLIIQLQEGRRQKDIPVVSGYSVLHAQVIKSSLYRSNNLLTIDKGEKDGVRCEMGVVCSDGVVGMVYQTSNHYSIVQPLINVNSRVSCRVAESNYFGVMQWEAGNICISYCNGVPLHAKIKKKARMETNGFSDIFPAGIPIGQVIKTEDSMDGLSQLFTVRLYTNFASLRDVGVITNYHHAERRRIEEVADSLENIDI